MTYKVGITGGIGSGKSTIARIFSVLGVPVFYADHAAKEIMQNDPEVISAIKKQFGEDMYAGGLLQRKKLAVKVFEDAGKLQTLNAIVHPATIRAGQEWMNRQSAPYILKEAALLFESGTAGQFDFIIGVYAPEPIRVQRVMQRDGVTGKEVISRMRNQLPESLKMKLCDAVIYNDEQQMVIPQVLALHEKLSRPAGKKL